MQLSSRSVFLVLAVVAVLALVAMAGCSGGTLPLVAGGGPGGGGGEGGAGGGGEGGAGGGGGGGGGGEGGGGAGGGLAAFVPDRTVLTQEAEVQWVNLLATNLGQLAPRWFSPLAWFDPLLSAEIPYVGNFMRHLGMVDGDYLPAPFPPGWQCQGQAVGAGPSGTPVSLILGLRMLGRPSTPVAPANGGGQQTWTDPDTGVQWTYTVTETQNSYSVDARGTDANGTDIRIQAGSTLSGDRVNSNCTVTGTAVAPITRMWSVDFAAASGVDQDAVGRVQINRNETSHVAERQADCSITFTVNHNSDIAMSVDMNGSPTNVAIRQVSYTYSGVLGADYKALQINSASGTSVWAQWIVNGLWWIRGAINSFEGQGQLANSVLDDPTTDGQWTSLNGTLAIDTSAGYTAQGTFTQDGVQGEIKDPEGNVVRQIGQ